MAEVRSQRSLVQTKRAEHEARTGCIENMRQLGWKCLRWSGPSTGEPVEFQKGVKLDPALQAVSDVRIVRTHGKMWRMEIDTGYKIPTMQWTASNVTAKRKLDTPLLPGPVAMAIWFELENSNGSVRIRSREDQACT